MTKVLHKNVEDNLTKSASCGSTVVEQLTHNSKFEGSDLAAMDARGNNNKNICQRYLDTFSQSFIRRIFS
jgi:hypothetical protein